MSKLAAKDSHEKRPFKPQVYKSRGQNRSYSWEVIRIEVIGQIAETGDSTEILGLDKIIERIIFKEIPGDMENRIVEENMEMIGAVNIVEVGID